MVSQHCSYIRSMLTQIDDRTGYTGLDKLDLLEALCPRADDPNDYVRLRIGLGRVNYRTAIAEVFRYLHSLSMQVRPRFVRA